MNLHGRSQTPERICSTEERTVKKSSIIRIVTMLQNVILNNNRQHAHYGDIINRNVKVQLVEFNRRGQKEKYEEGIKNEVRKTSKKWNKRK